MSSEHLERQNNDEWIESVGGLTKATLLVQKTLKCGFSKAEKVARGRYPSELPQSEQEAIADLMQRSKPSKRRAVVTRSGAKTG